MPANYRDLAGGASFLGLHRVTLASLASLLGLDLQTFGLGRAGAVRSFGHHT